MCRASEQNVLYSYEGMSTNPIHVYPDRGIMDRTGVHYLRRGLYLRGTRLNCLYEEKKGLNNTLY